MSTRMGGSPEIGAGCESSASVIVRRLGTLHAKLGVITRCRKTDLRDRQVLTTARKREASRRAVQLLEASTRVAQPHATIRTRRRSFLASSVVPHAQHHHPV